ncbi:MAG: PhzF family phenazine biosynthesis protein, partial [Candidatus Latescibacterota bacterium]
MGTIIFQVDSFAKAPFEGNPAGVCILAEQKEAVWMQNVAAEMNLSETAFVRRRPDGSFELRWFSPACEVDLCGHATLAAAHVLWESGLLDGREPARFNTRSGLLAAARKNEWIQLDFPAIPNEPAKSAKTLERALGITAVTVVKHRLGTLVEVDSADTVRNAGPKMTALAKVAGDIHIVTAASDVPEYDFVSRVFCPRIGIDEDPVTGAAHCCLGPYWKARTGKDD